MNQYIVRKVRDGEGAYITLSSEQSKLQNNM